MDSAVRFVRGHVCAAIPERDWELPISSIKLIAEFTTPDGPVHDYFYVFAVGDPPCMFQVPMEALEPAGFSEFFAGLETALPGPLVHRLASSVVHDSSTMWPEALVGERLFDFIPARRRGAVGSAMRKRTRQQCTCVQCGAPVAVRHDPASRRRAPEPRREPSSRRKRSSVARFTASADTDTLRVKRQVMAM